MEFDNRPVEGRVSTGIQGLDHLLRGGFLKSGFYLVQGDPGSGKTTVALQFLLHCAKTGGRALYISLTETRADLNRSANSHNWDLSPIQISDLTRSEVTRPSDTRYSVFNPADVELGQTVDEIFREVERVNPEYLVFDGLAEMRVLAGDPLKYRRQMLALKDFLEDRGITTLLLDDRTAPIGEIHPESIVGGSIVFESALPAYGGARRRLAITKVRGADFRGGYHDYDIVQGGVVVYPRLVAADHHEDFHRDEIFSGVGQLDAMLHGGLPVGTTTLILGPAGVGKSTLSMKYAATALESGRNVAVYAFDEVLNTLVERSEKLCANGIRQYLKDGHLHVRQVDPAELSPGAFAHEIRESVEERGASVIVIDSLNGYLNAMPEEKFLPTHLHELFSYLNQKGVLTIVVVAQHGLVSGQTEMDVSYLADTVLFLRYFEADSEIRQAVSVFKKRTGSHDRTLREVRITRQGVWVGEPLFGFHGIMTGVPQMANSPTALPMDVLVQ